MYENSVAREIAWQEADRLFPTDYEYDEGSKQRAGYPIYRSTVKDVNAWISDLNCRLEVNVEQKDHSISSTNVWVDYDWELAKNYGTKYTDEEYEKLDSQKDNEGWTKNEFAEWIANEFGFQKEKIHVMSDMRTWAHNKRTKVVRPLRFTHRDPAYNATDWNYCRFEVCGNTFEVIDGELEQIWE